MKIENDDKLRGLQVNHLISIQSPKIEQHLIGLVSKIIRKSAHNDLMEELPLELEFNIIKVVLIGIHFDREADKENVFRRSLSTIPSINAECYLICEDRLKRFMQAISSITKEESTINLQIGNYSIDEDATAWLNGNKLFQRHAVIVGSTGSGKSWCVAKILEQVAELSLADAILFDIHGEYSTLQGEGFIHLKVPGSNDTMGENMLFFPYWLLTYEEMISLMIDRLDSPIPYNLDELLSHLKSKDKEMLLGFQGRGKQGPYFGKLTCFIQRLETKQKDKRLNFMFSSENDLLCRILCEKLMLPSVKGRGGVKIIDFSEIPSDILPLIVSLIARIVFFHSAVDEERTSSSYCFFCDEAHLYINNNAEKNIDNASLVTFERIFKEGRKYGVGLVVISQWPSEVNRTVLSQSSNFIAMRLTNADDQSVVKRLLPDSLGYYADSLPILDIGEALVVGDASLLPSRIRITPPNMKPRSATIDFWDEWSKEIATIDISGAIEALRMQSKEEI